MRKRSVIPAWFKATDYAHIGSLGYAGWYHALAVRLELRRNLERTKTGELTPHDPDAFWQDFRAATDPSSVRADLPPWPPIEELSAARFATRKGRQRMTWEVITPGRSLLAVDLDAPDEVLMVAFKKWLFAARKKHPLPAKRRGRPTTAPNVTITPQHLDKWVRYSILAVFDLDIWAQMFGEPRLSHSQLSEALKPDLATGPKDWWS